MLTHFVCRCCRHATKKINHHSKAEKKFNIDSPFTNVVKKNSPTRINILEITKFGQGVRSQDTLLYMIQGGPEHIRIPLYQFRPLYNRPYPRIFTQNDSCIGRNIDKTYRQWDKDLKTLQSNRDIRTDMRARQNSRQAEKNRRKDDTDRHRKKVKNTERQKDSKTEIRL